MPGTKLTPESLHMLMPHATMQRVLMFFHPLVAELEKGKISTALRQAHFFAQAAHESGELRYTEEIASGVAYEGRRDLGNVQPGDGVRFKGRGLLQVTGRANYAAFGAYVGRDLLSDEGAKLVANDVELAAASAVWLWNELGLNHFADADDVEGVTRRINGGLNGLLSRKAYLSRAKGIFMGDLPAIVPVIHGVAEKCGEWPALTL